MTTTQGIAQLPVVTPDGKDIVVGGKLDTHCTVYSFQKMKALIDAKSFDGKDPYGVPILSFKDSIRGQVALTPHGLNNISIINVENACASGSTALHSAWMAIKSGIYDCVLAIGTEKMYVQVDPRFAVKVDGFISGTDVEETLVEGVRLLLQQGHIKVGDRIIMTMGEHTASEGGTNSMRLVRVGEDGYLEYNPSLDVQGPTD